MTRARRDFNERGTLSNVLYMGVPSMIGFAATNAYAIVDIFWVGLLGAPQVAALTLFQAFAFVLSSTNMLVGSGSVAIISRRFGEGDYEATRNVINQTIILKLILAVLIGGTGVFWVRSVLEGMNAEPDVVEFGVDYGLYFMVGLPFIFSSFTMFTALRGIGRAPKAMQLMLAMTAINMILDPILIIDRMPVDLSILGLVLLPEGTKVGIGLGIKGAAIARTVSTFICFVMGLLVLRFGRSDVKLRLRGAWRPDFRIMGRIIGIGVPPGIENVIRTVMNFVTAYFVAIFGTYVVAAYGYVFRILQLTTVFAVGMSLGTAAIVGMYLGSASASKASDAICKSVFIVLGIVGGLGLVIFFGAERLLSIFTAEAEVIAAGVPALQIMIVGQIMMAVRMVLASAFTGSGNTWPPTVIGAVFQSFRIGLIAALVLGAMTGQTGIWWAFTVAMSMESLMLFFWFRKGRWKHREV